MSEAVALAVDLIRKRGTARTPAIAEALEMEEEAVDAMLAPEAVRGVLTTCAVEIGGQRVIEYRLSATGGRLNLRASAPLKASLPAPDDSTPRSLEYRAAPPAPRQESAALQVPAKATRGGAPKADDSPRSERFEPATSAPADPARAADQPKGEQNVTFRDNAIQLFKKHGPMTTRELTARGLADANASTRIAQLAKNGELGILGGGPKSKIYGLPEQSIADRKEPTAVAVELKAPKEDKPPRHIHRRRKHAKPAKKTPVKTGRKAALKAWDTRRKGAAVVKFRPALAADGAILLLGAKAGDSEIPREQARALVDLQRRLTVPELAALVNFVTRLDNAEVGA